MVKTKKPAKATPPEETLDEFIQNWSDDDDDDNDDDSNNEEEEDDDLVSGKQINGHGVQVAENGDADSSDGEEQLGASQQKKYLASLKHKDPDFYKFLQENDKDLLNFNESSSEDEDDEDDGHDDKIHRLPSSLEVASDESDFDFDTEEPSSAASSRELKKSQIDKWASGLRGRPTVEIIRAVIRSFQCVVETVTATAASHHGQAAKAKKSSGPPQWIIVGDTVVNGMIRLCVTDLSSAVYKVLRVDESQQRLDPRKSNRWSKLSKCLKLYCVDCVSLVSALVSNEGALSALLKHIHTLIPVYSVVPKACKTLLKTLIMLWSTSNFETVRILSFMCIIRMTRLHLSRKDEALDEGRTPFLHSILKQLYMAYVRNVKFTSINTWPMINFMRRSLAEMFGLDQAESYRFVFIYIRQLAIHLRGALMQRKTKDCSDAICNWQFVHCCHLWAQLLSDANPSDHLDPLIYPLVQVITGALRFGQSAKFYPFRFHLCQQLTMIAQRTDKFVSVLPYYMDILSSFNFDRKCKKVSMKPLDFSCCLKVSHSQLQENGFKDATINELFCGIMDYLDAFSHTIGFPELVVPLSFELKQFLKKSRSPNYSKKMKQLMDKVVENGKMIKQRRQAVPFGVKNLDEIRIWQAKLRADGTPVSVFNASFKKAKVDEKAREITQKDLLDDYDFVPRMQPRSKATIKAVKQVKGLLDSDSEDDDIPQLLDEERFTLKEEREKAAPKKKEAKRKSQPESKPTGNPKAVKKPRREDKDEEEEDLVEDLDLSDDDA